MLLTDATFKFLMAKNKFLRQAQINVSRQTVNSLIFVVGSVVGMAISLAIAELE